MLNANDLEQLKAKGISEKQIEEQLACFVKGFPFLEIAASASVEKGIMVISKEEQASYMDAWDAYLAKNKKIVKFVPACGAASRMFKNLYEFLSADYKEPMNAFEKKFFSEIEKFAFYKALYKKCVENTAKDIHELVALGEYKEVDSYDATRCYQVVDENSKTTFDVTFYLYGDVVSGWDVAVADKASTNKK